MRTGGNVRLYADLIPMGGADPIARASVTTHVDDVTALTDSLTWMLLRQIWRTRGAPTPSLGAVTTKSIPALHAFLEGERRITEYRMHAAAESFARAIQADSTFWFAYWRHAWARELSALPVDSAIIRTYQAHRAEFPEPDRLLIETRMARDLNGRMMRARALTERHPAYWPGWFELGELFVHQAPYSGFRLREARAPLERAAVLNSSLTPAWDHLLWIAFAELDTTTSSRILDELKRLRYDSTSLEDAGTDMLRIYRYVDQVARSGGAPIAAQADSIVAAALVRRTAGRPNQLQGGVSRYGFHRARIDFGQRVLHSCPRRATAAALEWRAIATAWAESSRRQRSDGRSERRSSRQFTLGIRARPRGRATPCT